MADYTPKTGYCIANGILLTADGNEQSAMLTIADAVLEAINSARGKEKKVRCLAAALKAAMGGGTVAERFPDDLLQEIGIPVHV